MSFPVDLSITFEQKAIYFAKHSGKKFEAFRIVFRLVFWVWINKVSSECSETSPPLDQLVTYQKRLEMLCLFFLSGKHLGFPDRVFIE